MSGGVTMSKIIKLENLKLNTKEISNLKELSKKYEKVELKLASGSDIVACPYCRNNGCVGSCTMACS